MTIQADINANSSPIGQRVQALHDGGYGWMDPQAQTALASSPTSDQQMMASAGSYQNVFQQITSVPSQAVNAVGHFFDDPVLQKQPSAGLALQQYFLQRQGWAPIAEEDLTHIQQQLVTAGYLDKSEVSGVWTPASQQAFQQATSDHINKQTHEGQGFSITHVLGAFMPSHWIPAIVGMAKSVPDDMRSAIGDVYADMKSLPDVLTGQVGSQHYKQGMVKNQAAAINTLGGNTTPELIQKNYMANQLNAVNAVLTVLPVARAASVSGAAFGAASRAAAAKVAGDTAIQDASGMPFLRGMTTDLGSEAAQRGPGVIARSLYNPDGTGLVNSRFFQNNPILRQAVPPVRALTSGDGAYYAFRTGLAQPYRLAGVQALGTAVQQASTAGAIERGIAAVESKVGGRHTAFDDQVYSQGTIGGTLGLVLDMASGAFHGPLESAATRAAVAEGRTPLIGVNPSHTVGDLLQGSHQAVEAMLRPVNAGWAFNRGTAAMGAEHSVEELTAKYGETFTQALLNTKINQFAAAYHAEQNMPEGVSVGTQTGQDAWRALTHDALHDPQKLSAARDAVVSHLDELAARFMRDSNNIHRESRDEYRRGLDALAQVYRPFTDLLSHHKDELVTPLVGKTLADAQAEHQFATAVAVPSLHGMSRSDFLNSGEELHHGTSRQFDQFSGTNVQDRYNRDVTSGEKPIYFSHDRSVAHRFSQETGAHVYLDPERVLNEQDLEDWQLAESEADRQPLVDKLRRMAAGQEKKGFRWEQVDDETGGWVPAKATDLTNDNLVEGTVRAVRPGREPRVVTTKVYGRTLDLTDTASIPQDVKDALGASRLAKQYGQSYQHEYDPELLKIARRFGYGKIKVLDAPESGGSSVIALPEMIAHGRSPEDIFAAHATKPNVGPVPSASSAWLRQNKTDHEQGSFGVARRALPGEPPEMETQTARLATMKADEMQTRLTAAGAVSHNAEDLESAQPYDNAAVRAVRKDALTYLSVHGGLDSREMEGVDTPGLLGMIREKAKSMPKDVDLPLDPSPELKARYQKVLDAGFKPVIGTDIGHLFAPPVVDPMMVEGYNSKLRTLAEHMGLSTLPVSIKAAGTIRSALVERELQKAIDSGVIRVPPSINGARLHTFLLDNLASRAQLSRGESIAFNAARPLHKAQAEWIAGPNASKEDLRDAYRRIEDQIARNSSPLDAPKAQIVKALTAPQSQVLKDLAGTEGDVPFMDKASAERVSDLYQRAAFHEPAWAFGAGKLEDVFRAGFGFLGTNASYKVPVVRNIARLPSDLIKFRNRYRFQLDPMFSMRRVVKSALKGSLEGAPMTVRPFDHMVEAGTLDHDLGVLNRVKPMADAEGWDAMDRLAYEQDAFGLYNPRHHMALLAGELARQGLSDGEIRAKLDRAFTYGDRTALERTIGTFLYPFSFEKTLWRNVGSYLMDRPGQRLLVGAALQGYSTLAQHDHIDRWLQDHGPALKEFQKLNAFDHGIGPGAIGGINALYAPAVWNLFAPQKLQPQKDGTLNALMTVFPLMREVNSMLIGENTYNGTRHGGTLVQQAGIGLWGVQHAIDRGTQIAHLGTPADSVFHQIDKLVKVRSETYQAGQTSAYAYRNSLVAALAPVLDFNYHHRGSEKVWGQSAPAAVRGQTITKGSIDDIVHSVYPDFDPAAAQSTAVTKQKQMQRYLSDLKQSDPTRAASYQVFVDAANKVTPAIQRAENDPANYGRLAQAVDVFRQYATNLAEQDSTFLKFYNAYMISRFGPLEAVTL